jgi:hypothetical protein
MTTKVVPTLPDREALRALYDAAVAEINISRNNLLTTAFYAQTGDAVFNAGYLALSDAIADNRRMHTVSAPAGGGKTSFSYALIRSARLCWHMCAPALRVHTISTNIWIKSARR